jgi:hypothetical protein
MRDYLPLLLIPLLMYSSGTAADVYKWRDAQGHIHYGDHPPPGQGAQSMKIETAPAPDPDAKQRSEKQERVLDSFREDRQRLEKQREADKQKEAQRARKCARVRQLLEKATNAGFLYEKTNDPRNPRVLTGEQRQAEMARLRAEVQKWCD